MYFDIIAFTADIIMMLACARILLWKPTRSNANDHDHL